MYKVSVSVSVSDSTGLGLGRLGLGLGKVGLGLGLGLGWTGLGLGLGLGLEGLDYITGIYNIYESEFRILFLQIMLAEQMRIFTCLLPREEKVNVHVDKLLERFICFNGI